ncbi:hypothetical protein [Arhodomonas sp. AD133]|uniref:hypothetical protein n=1 Tax=Arhodomonas sp. AD133 TaxID=3415009 RepID=UPI003EBE91F0
MVKRITAMAVCLLAAGCTTPRVEHVTTPLPLPPRPALPAVPNEGLECLAPDVYRALVERDRARRDYTEQLEAIIESTHKDRDGARVCLDCQRVRKHRTRTREG